MKTKPEEGKQYSKHVLFECKALNDDMTMEGYGSVFGVVDSYDERTIPGSFKDSLNDHKTSGSMPIFLKDHDPSQVVGVFTEAFEDTKGLMLRAKFADTTLGKDAYTLVKLFHQHGQSFGMSIGYRLLKWEIDPTNKNVLNLLKVDLREVSLTPFPALPAAHTLGVKFEEGELPTEREFEKFLRDAGFSRNQARDVCERGFKALNKSRDEDPSTFYTDELIKSIKTLHTILKGN